MDTSIKSKLLEQMEELPYESQRQVLQFAQALALSVAKGVSGEQLLRFANTIPGNDLRLMTEAIEADCENIDRHGESVAG